MLARTNSTRLAGPLGRQGLVVQATLRGGEGKTRRLSATHQLLDFAKY
jgi:hypothetical protein